MSAQIKGPFDLTVADTDGGVVDFESGFDTLPEAFERAERFFAEGVKSVLIARSEEDDE